MGQTPQLAWVMELRNIEEKVDDFQISARFPQSGRGMVLSLKIFDDAY
jgi:hypothetical protein